MMHQLLVTPAATLTGIKSLINAVSEKLAKDGNGVSEKIAGKFFGSAGWREKLFEIIFFETGWRGKFFQHVDLIAARLSIKFLSKSESSSRFFGRLKFLAGRARGFGSRSSCSKVLN